MDPLGPAFLAAACIVYNNILNSWRPFHGPLYIPLNLVFAATTALIAISVVDTGIEEIGLRGDTADLGLGALGALVLTAPIFALATSRHAVRIADQRVADLRGSELAYQVLLRIPFGTALTEEVIFRGVLFAAWRAAGLSTIAAAITAALVFGLWHIAPTINLMRANAPQATPQAVAATVTGAVVFTTAAGMALTWLRLVSGGLLAPVVLHAGTNSLGTIAAVIAARRSGRVGGPKVPAGG